MYFPHLSTLVPVVKFVQSSAPWAAAGQAAQMKAQRRETILSVGGYVLAMVAQQRGSLTGTTIATRTVFRRQPLMCLLG
jgi:hypothetical protein